MMVRDLEYVCVTVLCCYSTVWVQPYCYICVCVTAMCCYSAVWVQRYCYVCVCVFVLLQCVTTVLCEYCTKYCNCTSTPIQLIFTEMLYCTKYCNRTSTPIQLIFTEMLYCTKYCNRTSTPINTNNWILSDASKQLSNDILIQVSRWQQLDSAVPTESSQ
jgi:hypothetical protein